MVTIPERVVIFADALGTGASTMDTVSAQAFLDRLLDGEQKIERRLSNAARKVETLEYRWFSDSFMIAAPPSEEQSVLAMVELVAQIQLEFLLAGVFLRGAMTLGPHYHSRNIDYGPALNRAVKLEHTAARVPRVVASDEVQAVMQLATEDLRSLFVIDRNDSKWFINFFSLLGTPARGLARERISRAYHEAAERDRAKYMWLANYFDFTVGKAKKIGLPVETTFEQP